MYNECAKICSVSVTFSVHAAPLEDDAMVNVVPLDKTALELGIGLFNEVMQPEYSILRDHFRGGLSQYNSLIFHLVQ